MAKEQGRKVWFFPDGDLPLAGEVDPKGYESLVLLNPNTRDAIITLTVYYETRTPDVIPAGVVGGQRVRCIRVDKPVGEYQIPMGQYALKVESSVGIIAQIGRMDIRQPNLAYYTTIGYGA